MAYLVVNTVLKLFSFVFQNSPPPSPLKAIHSREGESFQIFINKGMTIVKKQSFKYFQFFQSTSNVNINNSLERKPKRFEKWN